jgi:DNA primase
MMIPEQTVATILDSARIEEVVGDFVTLKRRGVNLLGVCPFHNEKTPSFTVSPSKGIYKCFGCGAAGSSVKFVMEHEKMTYPEALRYLAKKYNITIEEVNNEESLQEKQHLDSLYISTDFARQHFTNNLLHTDEGQSVALSYFKERGFTPGTIEQFQLGYSLESYDALLKEAQKGQYSVEVLQKTGLIIQRDERFLPFFRARVMFPIHNLSGKVVAFAGRTLSKDKKQPKYINSPETDIYVKSKILYGIFFAKKEIRQKDECILVEGYTDVISLVQAGIENVVASSGTSLTIDQIRLINRFTPNITMLYDGDAAGIKAALRGVDLILEENMNVKVVVLPPDEDPDSYVKKHGKTETLQYIHQNAKDFVFFKTQLLLEEAGSDPIKRTALVRDIIQTIALIPDPIKRLMYIKECSQLLEVPENLIISETNRLKWKKVGKDSDKTDVEQDQIPPNLDINKGKQNKQGKQHDANLPNETICEREIIRLLLEFGSKEIEVEKEHHETQHTFIDLQTVAACIVRELAELPFEKPHYAKIYTYFKERIGKDLPPPTSDFFLMNPDEQISGTAIDLLTSPYEISDNWEAMHGIFITDAVNRFKDQVFDVINRFKLTHILKMLDDIGNQLKTNHDPDEQSDLIHKHILLSKWKQDLAKLLGITIIR